MKNRLVKIFKNGEEIKRTNIFIRRLNMYSKEGLLKRLPKKYHERINDLYEEEGLIDDCKFIITLKEPYHFEDGGLDYPCKNYKEAIYILRTIKGEER